MLRTHHVTAPDADHARPTTGQRRPQGGLTRQRRQALRAWAIGVCLFGAVAAFLSLEILLSQTLFQH